MFENMQPLPPGVVFVLGFTIAALAFLFLSPLFDKKPKDERKETKDGSNDQS